MLVFEREPQRLQSYQAVLSFCAILIWIGYVSIRKNIVHYCGDLQGLTVHFGLILAV